MAATEVKVRMQQRRDTAAGWTSANSTLLNGELGFETDTKKAKLGDGSTAWNSLAYYPGFSISGYPLATADISDDAITADKLANTSVTAAGYGSASQVGTFTVDAQGRLTAAADVSIAVAASAITSGTLAVDRGGTGSSSFTDGQLLIGNSTGNTLTKATLTSGTGITITNGGGSVTIASAGATGPVLENLQTIASDYTLTSNYNALSAGPVSVDAGVTVTVPSGATWAII